MNGLKYVSNVQEVEILVRDEDGIGIGNARLSQDNIIPSYISEMHQDRLNLELTDDDDLLERLAEGKSYIGDDNTTLLAAVNSVLDFWFVAPTTEDKIKEVPQFKSLKEALSYFSITSEKYLVCSILYIVKNILWKYDSQLGIAYFCPNCKLFLCGHDKKCECGQEINWQTKDEYKGKVKWN